MQNFPEFFKKLNRNSSKIFYKIKYLPENIFLEFLEEYNFNSRQNFFWKFSSNFYNLIETLLKFAEVMVISLQTYIKFLQKFHKRFASIFRITVTNYSRFQQNFLPHFRNYFNSSHNFPKILGKNSFLFRHSSTTPFF